MEPATAERLRESALEHGLVAQRLADVFAARTQGSALRLARREWRLRDDEADAEYCPEFVLLSGRSEIHTIVEITGSSAVNDVYGDRARCYRSIPSLEHYVIAWTDKPGIVRFSRVDGSRWWYGVAEGMDAEIRLESPRLTLKLAEVYEGVFTADEPSA